MKRENYLINSGFEFNQRVVTSFNMSSVVSTATYVAYDRWKLQQVGGGGNHWSVATSTDTVDGHSVNTYNLTSDSASTRDLTVSQFIESNVSRELLSEQVSGYVWLYSTSVFPLKLAIATLGTANDPSTVGSDLVSSVDATVTITNASPAVCSTSSAHNLQAGDKVVFSTTGSLPTGLTAGTLYYVISAGLTSTSFQVSATNGGSAINTSSAGSGTHTVRQAAGGSTWTKVRLPNYSLTDSNTPNGVRFYLRFYSPGVTATVKVARTLFGPTGSKEWTRFGKNFDEELEACRRYYEKSYQLSIAPDTSSALGMWGSAVATLSGVAQVANTPFKVTKRITPSVSTYRQAGSGTLGNWDTFSSGGASTARSVSVSDASEFGFKITCPTIGTDVYAQGHWVAEAEI